MIIQLINIFRTNFGCSSMKSRNAELLSIKKVYSLFYKVSDGAHGNTSGFHGSLTPHIILKFLKLSMFSAGILHFAVFAL